ncbi:helix-turn-helix domain-containing protein [Novosphingobium sp. PASSN1]|uniref:helix-turn-helix domain-containing protein n=1 Tax=Novosphingobium sp. PASSN1 TaxID=2015561 RepID=UPI000BCBBEA8|nr:helix-turn-helix domain-containing protein [Novosphingobium sp. PASSN1]OYU34836.1 MAG: hypothetical protein CFE35_13185 [Novosphingobium sp. PASSN1]
MSVGSGLSNRIRERIEKLQLSQAAIAHSCGCSPARFGNYVTGIRNPDLKTLARIAVALRTTTDHLLGLSPAVPDATKAVILRVLELEGMEHYQAQNIAQIAEEALQLFAALPNDGDAEMRAGIAAQAAWQVRQRL